MKRLFIKVRFDRMQNMDLKILCQHIHKTIQSIDAEALQLDVACRRFGQMEPHFKNLFPKHRKMPQTETIVKLRKRMDDLISALLLHIKALKRADFPEQHNEVIVSEIYIRKLFKNFVHEGILAKNGNLNEFFVEINKKEELYNTLEKIGLSRYIDALVDLRQQIKKNTQQRTDLKLQQPRSGVTISSKEQIISELQILLQTIEITAITHPEIDYNELISFINQYLIEARAQLRNLASRRKTALVKAEKKKESEN